MDPVLIFETSYKSLQLYKDITFTSSDFNSKSGNASIILEKSRPILPIKINISDSINLGKKYTWYFYLKDIKVLTILTDISPGAYRW